MDEAQIEAFSERTAQKLLRNLADILGADVDSAEGRAVVRANWSWLTETRVRAQFVGKTTLGAAVVSIVGAIIGGIAWAAKTAIAAISAAGQAVIK